MRTLRTLAPFGAAALILGAASCSAWGTASSPAALPMQQHWAAGNDLQHAMVQGDLAAARRAALAISEVDEIPGLMADAVPYLQGMRVEAEAVRNAPTFEEAAHAAARMAAACGACHSHQTQGAGPRPEGATTAPAPGEGGTQSHMLLHAWAVDRMWEGLVVPSSDRWRAGARALAEQPISAAGFSPEVGLIGARVHEMARQGLEDPTPADQADRLGRILSDCAGCHAELGLR